MYWNMGELLVSAMFWQQTLETPVEVPIHNKYTQEQVTQKPIYKYHLARKRRNLQARSFKTAAPQKKIETTLIIAPHPDDEILCCSLKIRDKLRAGNRVKVVYLTDGDALRKRSPEKVREYASIRRNESIAATSKLGLKRGDLIFLGFPDGHLEALNEQVLTSRYSDRQKTPPGSFRPGSSYTRTNLTQQLAQLINQFRPSEIYTPSHHLDTHSDHQEAEDLVHESLILTAHTPKIFTYAIHDFETWLKTKAPKNPWKLNLIQYFKSQFHDDWHRTYLEKFAAIPEKFELYEEVAKK